MISVRQINLVVQEEKSIFVSNGARAKIIQPGNYIAVRIEGDEPGWYSLHSSNEDFSCHGVHEANVYLALGTTGEILLMA